NLPGLGNDGDRTRPAISPRQLGEDPDVGAARGSIHWHRGGRGREESCARRHRDADAIGCGARKPDQPVPVPQAPRRRGYPTHAGPCTDSEEMIKRLLFAAALPAAALSIGGCATTPGTPSDPWEGMNRAIFSFNEAIDSAVLKPVATGYQKVLP